MVASIIMENMFESIDVEIYKQLLRVLGDYIIKTPVTGINKLFDMAIEGGKKILPKDKHALAILKYVLCNSVPTAVQKLLNMRFSDLPKAEFRPITKVGRTHEVAFWSRGLKISDKVKDLIDFEGTGKSGMWSDLNGKIVSLLDLSKEKK